MHIVIIGNGIAGITAARYIRKKSDHTITVISAETPHFFSRTALMYVYMGHERYEDIKPYEDWFWEENRIHLLQEYVTRIHCKKGSVTLASGREIRYDKLIIATGSQSNKSTWPGQDLNGVQGLYSWQDLENLEQITPRIKRGVIVGGGLIGVELAEMLKSRGKAVTLLVREAGYWGNVLPAGEAKMVSEHIRRHHIDLQLSDELAAINGNEEGWVSSVTTKAGQTIPCEFVGLTVGVHPNIDLVKLGGEIEVDRGILVNDYFETNVSNIYAIGDCAQMRTPPPHRKPIEPVWYVGKIQGKQLAENICGERKRYHPGPWFNSAKFFDIEYQTYGSVPSGYMDGYAASIFWMHSDGEKSIRLVYDTNDNKLIGVNLLGVRYRHEVVDHWIREGWKLKQVVEQLSAANFDPEFFKKHENEIVAIYNQRFPNDPVKLKKPTGILRKIMLRIPKSVDA